MAIMSSDQTKNPATLEEYLAKGLRVLLLDGYARQILPMAEYLNRLGATVATLNVGRLDVGCVSRWVHERYFGPAPRRDLQGTLEKMREVIKSGNFDVVISGSDETAMLLAENKSELSPYAALAVNNLPVFERARDKLLTMKACEELGLPHPRTLDASLPDLPDQIRAANIEFPVVIKPRKASGALGFKRIDRIDDLLGFVQDATEKFGPMLLQEYVPQTDLQYKSEILLDREGKVRSCVTFNKVRWFPHNGGSSALSETVRRSDVDETSIRLLRGIGWRGYGDVDLIQDPRDGIAKVMEINPRITGCVKICFDAGVDFARQVVEDALDLPVTDYLDYKIGRRLRYLHTDILWFFTSPNRWRTKPSWFDFRRTTDQIFSFRDPLPGITYSLQAFGKFLSWKKKRQKGK